MFAGAHAVHTEPTQNGPIYAGASSSPSLVSTVAPVLLQQRDRVTIRTVEPTGTDGFVTPSMAVLPQNTIPIITVEGFQLRTYSFELSAHVKRDNTRLHNAVQQHIADTFDSQPSPVQPLAALNGAGSGVLPSSSSASGRSDPSAKAALRRIRNSIKPDVDVAVPGGAVPLSVFTGADGDSVEGSSSPRLGLADTSSGRARSATTGPDRYVPVRLPGHEWANC